MKDLAANLKSTVRRLFSRVRFHLGENPARDWMLLLSALVLVSALLITFSALRFRDFVANGSSSDAATSTTRAIMDRALVDRVVDFYESRRRAEDKLLANPPLIVDQSR